MPTPPAPLSFRISLHLARAPQREGSESWRRYEAYSAAKTLRQVVMMSVDAGAGAAEEAARRKVALADIKSDHEKARPGLAERRGERRREEGG